MILYDRNIPASIGVTGKVVHYTRDGNSCRQVRNRRREQSLITQLGILIINPIEGFRHLIRAVIVQDTVQPHQQSWTVVVITSNFTHQVAGVGIYMRNMQGRPFYPYMYFLSGSSLSNISMLFSYIVKTIPPLIINLANLGSAPLQNVRMPSCLKMMVAHRNELP